MPTTPPPPVCDLTCQTKIIINGDTISGILGATCEGVKFAFEQGAKIENGEQIIKLLNDMEDMAIEVQKLVLAGVKYKGPTGKMLS